MLQDFDRGTLGQFSLIAVGSNADSVWGFAKETVTRAITAVGLALDATPVVSRFYATPAFPAGAGPDFVNAAIRIQTMHSPAQILEHLHQIEKDAGRQRTKRWGQRTLDLDLIAYGDQVLPNIDTFTQWRDLPLDLQMSQTPDQLILPHPRLQDRSFVLVPLADVAPDWVHPILGADIATLLAARPADERASVIALP